MKRFKARQTYLLCIFIMGVFLISGCGGGGGGSGGGNWDGKPDSTAPMVTFTDPVTVIAPGVPTSGVAINKKISATFTEAMDPATITTATFTLTQGVTPVSGTVSYTGVTAVFTPTSNLLFSTTYTATITTGARDVAGNALASDYVWSFTTGAAPDTTAPTVTSTDPANGDTGVAINKKIAATFSEAMDPLTITTATFTLTQGGAPVAGTVIYAGVTATFTPAANLAYSTVYTATITTGAKDLAGNALAVNKVWTFTTGAAPDTTAPTVSSTIPVNGATGVAVNSSMSATFSEAMDPLTVTTATFTLTQGGAPVAGTVIYAGVTAVFTPTSNLAYNTTYTATITTGAKDLAGNALAVNKVWTFTTGAAPDTTAPTVSSTIPVNGATGVAVNSSMSATFSEAMDPLTITNVTFTLKQGATAVDGAVTYAGVTATFKPTADLAYSTVYTATITTGAKDLAGNALAVNKVWSFTTGAAPDTTAPTVSSTIPVNGATGVAVNSSMSATFSEAMDPLTITNVTFTLKQGATAVDGAVTYAGVTAVFTPTSNLAYNTTYTATITTGAKDLAGNALAVNKVWTFTTGAAPDTTAPTVISTNPIDLTVGICINKTISATFSEAMDPLTITTATFTLAPTATPGSPVTGVVAYDAPTKIATFNPDADLAANTNYTATIKGGASGVKDLAGNALAVDKVWTFTTGTTVCQVPVPLGSSSNFVILASTGITNIPTSAITGDVGLSPGAGSSISGLTCPEVTGTIYVTSAGSSALACEVISPAILTAAKDDAEIAFINANAAARGTPAAISGNLNGLTLYPGLYESGTSLEISPAGFLYLDAQGDVNAVFIIRSATSITTAATSEVVLTGGAKATNVFWTAGSSVTLGTNSKMKGTMIAGTAISLLTGANLEGRALTQGAAAAAITLDQSTITVPLP